MMNVCMIEKKRALHVISRADSDDSVNGIVIGNWIHGGLHGQKHVGATLNVHFYEAVAGGADPVVIGGGGKAEEEESGEEKWVKE